MLARTALRAAQIGLAVLVAAYLLYFADHARLLLGFAHPLDYGEGPLLAQVEQLRAGTPIWRLYADPSAPPYLVVNYPPLYLLLCAGLAGLTGSALLAGRLISLLAALAAVAAIAALARPTGGGAGGAAPPPKTFFLDVEQQSRSTSRKSWGRAAALSLLFLTVPIVREWAALMRVDMLGVALALWGLAALGRPGERRQPLLAGLLLLASLFTKPSLLAAPAAAVGWLLWERLRAPRGQRARPLGTLLALITPLVLGGGLLLGLLQWASGGWFALHVVAANANRWDAGLAWGFWAGQARLRWPLAAAAAAALIVALARWQPRRAPLAPAAIYILAGTLTAAGVGKVGAYSNYFLELYAGLVWVVAARWQEAEAGYRLSAIGYRLSICLLLIASLIFYPPLWDPTWPRVAGLVAPSPPRLALGRYGLWADAGREADLLAAFGRVDAALEGEARAAGRVFTDMPGVAAAAAAESAHPGLRGPPAARPGPGRPVNPAGRPGRRPAAPGRVRLPGQLAHPRGGRRHTPPLRPGWLARHLRHLPAGERRASAGGQPAGGHGRRPVPGRLRPGRAGQPRLRAGRAADPGPQLAPRRRAVGGG